MNGEPLVQVGVTVAVLLVVLPIAAMGLGKRLRRARKTQTTPVTPA